MDKDLFFMMASSIVLVLILDTTVLFGVLCWVCLHEYRLKKKARQQIEELKQSLDKKPE